VIGKPDEIENHELMANELDGVTDNKPRAEL